MSRTLIQEKTKEIQTKSHENVKLLLIQMRAISNSNFFNFVKCFFLPAVDAGIFFCSA